MKYLSLILLFVCAGLFGQEVKISELPTGTSPDANDPIIYNEDGVTKSITKSLWQKSVRDSVDLAFDSLAVQRNDINANTDSIAPQRTDILENEANIDVVAQKSVGVNGFSIDSVSNDTMYAQYDGEVIKIALASTTPPDPPAPILGVVHPISHDQKYIIHDDMNNGDYVGEVYTNWTDTIFGNRTDANYAFSILSGNTGTAFAINATSGLITVNDYTQIGADFTLSVRVAHTDDADTVSCHLNYRTSPVFIDWGYSGTESGTRAQPYNSFQSDIGTAVAGTTYLFERGETSAGDYIDADNVGDTIFFAAYGTGDRPVIDCNDAANQRGILAGSCWTISDTDSTDATGYGKFLEFYDFEITDVDDQVPAIEFTNNSYGCELHRIKATGNDGNGVFYTNPKENHATGLIQSSNFTVNDLEIYQEADTWSTNNSSGVKLSGGGCNMTNVKVISDCPNNQDVYGIRFTGGSDDTVRYVYISGGGDARGGLQIRCDSSLFEWGYVDSSLYYGIMLLETDGAYYTNDFSVSGTIVKNFWLDQNSTVNSASVWGSIAIDTDVNNTTTDDAPRNLTFENILITNSGSGGVEINNRTISGNARPPANLTFNKIIVVDGQDSNAYYDGDGILVPSGATGTTITNSIFYNLESAAYSVTNNATGVGTFRNNIYENLSGSFSTSTNNYDIDDGNPFVGSGDYQTADGAYKDDIKNAGYDIGNTYDILGNEIDTQDIGPFEYGGTLFNWTNK